MHNKLTILLLALFIVLVIAGCTAGPNASKDTPDSRGKVAGFWKGLWHGIISPITFIISLFQKNMNFYEVHNNGEWYNLGFVIGAGILFGSGRKVTVRKCNTPQ